MDGIRPQKLLMILPVLAIACTEAMAGSARPSTRLLNQLSDNEKAPRAVAKIIKMGPRAIPALSGVVTEHESILAKGWAIVAVGRIGGTRAKQLLGQWYNSGRNSELIRVWAGAARIEAADNLPELQGLYSSMAHRQALHRPWNKRVREVISMSGEFDENNIEKLLAMANSNPQIRQAITEIILKQPTRKLAKIMFKSNNTQSRRMAASYIGTQANTQGVEKVAGDLLELYAYNGSASKVPWSGGALYVPGIQWPRRAARVLMSNLIQWLRFTEDRGLRNESRQLMNNLRSVGLHRSAGIRLRGRNNQAQTYFNLLEQL